MARPERCGEQWLVADIGGTRLRAALSDGGMPIHTLCEMECAAFAGPGAALDAYLAQTGAKPVAAALALAGPVAGDEFRFTNNPWVFSQKALREHLGLRRLLLLNDFEALAQALPSLTASDLHPLGRPMPRAEGRLPLAVLGPGTGLGVAALMPHAHGWTALPGEGGHIGFAPQDDLEREIDRVLRRAVTRVSNETILCGAGLVALYRALAAIEGRTGVPDIGAADIAQLALAGTEALALRAVDVFCAVLGAVAGDVALLTGARGGVFIGGGIAPRLLPLLEASRFRTRFEDKGVQRDYAGAIATSVIVAPVPALAGAVAALRANA